MPALALHGAIGRLARASDGGDPAQVGLAWEVFAGALLPTSLAARARPAPPDPAATAVSD